jgi:uncharacterized membrane protein YgcG
MDDEMHATDAGTIELGRRLDAYALARLTPDPQATARTRARVLREARLSFDAARIAVHVAPAIAASNRTMRRRLVMPFLAAAVWLSIAVGSISAAQAGGPLYPTRMWVETALLPSDPIGRTDAELDRMDARVAEAVSGAARGDRMAVSAALDAYFEIADDAISGSSGDPDLEARVARALNQHQDVLALVAARLADKGNSTASDAIERNIERAIEHNAAVILNIGSHDNSSGGGGSGGAGSTGGGSGGGNGGAAGNPPASSDPTHPEATPSPKPDKSPKPASSEPAPSQPAPSQPDHSPHGPSD